jgi:hypothetical protein
VNAFAATTPDSSTDLSPPYRHCVGKLGGPANVAARFEREAFRMYIFDGEAYDAAWGDRIPPELCAAAAHFYKEVL